MFLCFNSLQHTLRMKHIYIKKNFTAKIWSLFSDWVIPENIHTYITGGMGSKLLLGFEEHGGTDKSVNAQTNWWHCWLRTMESKKQDKQLIQSDMYLGSFTENSWNYFYFVTGLVENYLQSRKLLSKTFSYECMRAWQWQFQAL